jgi:hypothetical protein
VVLHDLHFEYLKGYAGGGFIVWAIFWIVLACVFFTRRILLGLGLAFAGFGFDEVRLCDTLFVQGRL